ncbi:ferrous iron transport protein A [Bacillota bacterium LX-D]|nr:ferrous iron transport protein A [Bacillota bacterium LX-D]
MTLDKVKYGQRFKIIHIPNESIKMQTIRFGISEGESLLCDEVIPAGPIIIRKNRQQLAIGRHLAAKIKVELD